MKKLAVLTMFFLFVLNAYAKDVNIIKVEGIVSGYTYKFINSAVEKCVNEDSALVIKLDTPGGLLESTRDIVQLLLESKVPVAVYVSPQGARAGSAGTFIVLASDYAAMAEGTNIGAAHPVSVTGSDIDGDMRKKIENDTAAFIRSIAEKRGRDAETAVKTVLESSSFTAKEALDKKLIDAVINTDDELISKFAEAENFEYSGHKKYLTPTPLERVAFFLSSPNILILLLFIGILAVVLEVKMPGTFIFAAIGIAAIVMFLMGINIIPINLLGLMLLLLGIILIVAEIFITSFGLLTAASVVSMAFGMYFLFTKEGNMGIRVSPYLIFIIVGFFAAAALLIGRLIIKDFLNKPATGLEKLVGENGKIVSWDGQSGMVFVHGEIWKAKSDKSFADGSTVKIKSINGLLVEVTDSDEND